MIHESMSGDEADLRYRSGGFDILKHGSFVLCAVTRVKIPIEDLRYWSADLQEAYVSAEVSFKRFLETRVQSSDSSI